jgi:hypothetical protein
MVWEAGTLGAQMAGAAGGRASAVVSSASRCRGLVAQGSIRARRSHSTQGCLGRQGRSRLAALAQPSLGPGESGVVRVSRGYAADVEWSFWAA